MNNNTSKKKGNTAKKLLPAAGMLAVSASMLATSTYAWFTMSREVEVQNIQMVATTPEDIQISLGKIYDASEATTTEAYSLTGSTGWLKLVNGEAEAPREGTGNSVDPKHELDWSNSADISKYYEFGKLIPASSTDGENVFYTPDAGGVGRTLKASASFYQAAEGLTAYKTGGTAAVGNNEDSAKATAHILTSSEIRGNTPTLWSAKAEDAGGYKKSTEWKATNDDGYYIDIPVWLRTSSTEAPNIYVTGYVTDKTEENKNDADDLYKAVRVAILDSTGAADKGCLALTDGGDAIIDPITGNVSHVAAFPANLTAAATNILDSGNYNGRASLDSGIYAVNATTMTAVSGAAADSNQQEVSHAAITVNNAAAANNVATLTAGTGTGYGASTKLIIRVWLEGEDINCWNENAGQDWNIALKFSKDPLTTPTSP